MPPARSAVSAAAPPRAAALATTRRAARMGPGRPLPRHRTAGASPPTSRGAEAECRAFADALSRQARRDSRRPATATLGAGRDRATRRSRTCSAASMSYAGLVYAGDTTDPARAKFYGDVQERLTAASSRPAVLHAGAQPDRRRACSTRRSRDAAARPLPAVARGHAQGEALPARRPDRAALPREVGDRAAAPGTGCSTRPSPSLRFEVRRRGAGARADAEPAAGRRTRAAREAAAEALADDVPARTCASSRCITNTLAKDKEISDRWRGFEDVADCAPPRRTGSSPRWWTRWSRPCATPIRACRTATTR